MIRPDGIPVFDGRIAFLQAASLKKYARRPLRGLGNYDRPEVRLTEKPIH